MAEPVSSNQASRYEWKVENALSIESVESDEFVVCESRWRLHLNLDGSGYMNVSLKKLSSEKLNRRYVIRSFIEDWSEKPVRNRECVLDDPCFASKEDIWWIPRTVLLRQCDRYLPHGTLTFVIVFNRVSAPATDTTGERVSDKSIQTAITMDTVSDLEMLSSDFHNLMDDGVQSDVMLKCGERCFAAHKGILSARSEVFAAMFRSDMSETRSGVVRISDVDSSVLDQFLHYVYSGKLPDLHPDSAPKLYAAADKYSMEPLKNLCAKFLERNLTRENACKTLVLADTHADRNLKDSVLHFIVKEELLRNKDILFKFHEQHPKLATEVLHHAYEAKCLSKVT